MSIFDDEDGAWSKESERDLFLYLGYSRDQVKAMEFCRALILPKMDEKDDKHFYTYVLEYLRNTESSALVHYATDGDIFSGFLWKRNFKSFYPIYFRQQIGANRLKNLQMELSLALNVDSIWDGRSQANLPKTRSSKFTRDARNVSDIAKDISDIMFPKELLEELKNIKHLTIVPVQGMSALPISLLEPFDDGLSVIDLFSVTFMAFIADIRQLTTKWKNFENPLVIGNPRPSIDSEYLWISLPGSEAEAIMANASLGGEIYLKEIAVKRNLIKNIEKRDLLYFAGHGYTKASQNLDQSFIVLGDGRLTAKEIQSLNLAGKPLVVLSACHTGEGYAMEAGIVGLARAFQIAGASQTVMSLWAVDDVATAVFMRYFVEFLQKDPPPEALRKAALSIKKQYPSPSVWAAFNVFGNQAETAAPLK